MTLEEREYYFSNLYEDYGIPENISSKDFFDIPLIDYILKEHQFVFLDNQDWIELLKSCSDSQERMNKIIELACKKGINVNAIEFEEIMKDDILATNFLNTLIAYINSSGFEKNSVIKTILDSDVMVQKIKKDSSIDVSIFKNCIFNNPYQKKERILILLEDERFVNLIYNLPITDFLTIINRLDLSIELNELIIKKIDSLSYKDKISIFTTDKYYNPVTGEPKYLQDLFYSLENQLKRIRIRSMIEKINVDSSIEDIETAKRIINTAEGVEILLKEILEPKFSTIINTLGLGKEYYIERKKALKSELNEYEKYDIETRKNLLCIYCFNDNYSNIVLKIKTLIEYASKSEEFLLLIREELPYLVKLQKYLINTDYETSPLELISSINIEDLLLQAHSIFQNEINKKTNIGDILNGANYTMRNSVKVIDVDIPIERSYFLVHSISNSADNSIDVYRKNATRHSKICMSLLHNDHMKTFSNGIVFGYCNIKSRLYSAAPFDAQTSQHRITGRQQFRSVLTNIDEFLHQSKGKHNEVAFVTNNEMIMPSYIFIANREPNEKEFKAAQEFDIPILIYRTKKRDIKIDEEINPQQTPQEKFDYSIQTLDYIPNETEKRKNIVNNF